MADPLSDTDVEWLRGVLSDPKMSGRNIPTGRTVTADRVGDGKLQLTVRSGGPNDEVAAQVAAQVFGDGSYEEIASRYPGERVFTGWPREGSA